MKIYKVASAHIVSEIFADEEAAVIDLKSGNYYSLNKTGAQIWRLIEQGFALEQIEDILRRRFAVDDNFDETQIRSFVIKLEDENLIATADRSVDESLLKTDSEIIGSPAGSIYEPPVVETYADMQEILLLDPIHEVEESSWLTK